jgi:proline racemase
LVAPFLLSRPFYLMRTYTTLDAHVAGEAVRLLVEGGPSVAGPTMQDKLVWMRKHADRMRRCLMLEPRGHAGMHGALFTEPVTDRAHAGLLFMNAAGFPAFSGEGVVAAVTLAVAHKLLHAGSDELLIDTPAGLIPLRLAGLAPVRPTSFAQGVALTCLPSFVLSAGLPVQVGARTVRVDIAFGGEFYAIVDSESMGVPIDPAHGPQLVRAGIEITNAVKAVKKVQGTVFTGPARGAADLRTATVLEGGVLRRSPGVAGTSALMAVLDAMGLLTGDQTFTHEGILGTSLAGRVLSRQPSTEDSPATVTPLVEGRAWYHGKSEFQIDDEDPLAPYSI